MKSALNARGEMYYPDLALCLPRILLPAAAVKLPVWPVVACDQYTSEPEYWQKVEIAIGDFPSTLQLIYPEVYLDAGDRALRIARIHQAMQAYLADGVVKELPPGMMLVERDTGYVKQRRGVVLALDLEAYDFRPGSRSLIRATEATVPARLPPRVAIREGAALELSHILMLVDDRGHPLMDDLFAGCGTPDYAVELLAGGGALRGWQVGAKDNRVEQFIAKLAAIQAQQSGDAPILIAVGDGNHSFAAAKSWWSRLKAQGVAKDHPARWALVELLSLYDQGLRFEPIHRLVGLAEEALLTVLPDLLGVATEQIEIQRSGDSSALSLSLAAVRQKLAFGLVGRHGAYLVTVSGSPAKLAVELVEGAMDRLRQRQPAPDLDYIHGLESTWRLAQRPGWSALILPALSRENLFPAVLARGSLPRKSFSLGEADEKRYYMEARQIIL